MTNALRQIEKGFLLLIMTPPQPQSSERVDDNMSGAAAAAVAVEVEVEVLMWNGQWAMLMGRREGYGYGEGERQPTVDFNCNAHLNNNSAVGRNMAAFCFQLLLVFSPFFYIFLCILF